jgi:hypothetical protein
MTLIIHANSVRNPDPRIVRLLIDKNLAPELAARIAGDPGASRHVLGALMPGEIVRRTGSRRRA